MNNSVDVRKNSTAILIGILFSVSPAVSGASPRQSAFATPKDALNAVITACEHNKTSELVKIFGPDGKDVVESGDPSDDADNRKAFAKAAHEKAEWIADPANADKMILSIGQDDYPFPIPLIRLNGQWHFDSAQGRQEILARRIGSNELSAMEVMRGYVEAQFEYAQDHRANGVPHYAQKIVSTPGKQDGLYWEAAKGAPECDVPKGFAQAAESMAQDKREPYHGYYFKILAAQGPAARGGAVNYVIKNEMIGGFGLLAWPSQYSVSGVESFMVNNDGTVYQNDLGPDTKKAAEAIVQFNPAAPWKPLAPDTQNP